MKLIVDIIDMWPESLPFSFSKEIFPLNIWRSVRSRNIGCCDVLVTECDLYQDALKKEYQGDIRTIYWSRDAKAVIHKNGLPDDYLSLVYIGSINHIIDVRRIADVISGITVPVKLQPDRLPRLVPTIPPTLLRLPSGMTVPETFRSRMRPSCSR